MKKWGIAVATISALMLVGCSNRIETAPAPVVTATEEGVPWADYEPGLQDRLDTLAATKECDILQGEFEIADRTNGETLDRTGHNNADLMAYIDAALREAGCY